MDETRVKVREETDSIHFANVLYWRDRTIHIRPKGTTHSQAATAECEHRQSRLREVRAAQLAEFDS